MNRAERRRQEKQGIKADKTFNVTRKQLVEMLENENQRIRLKATEDAFELMMIVPAMIYHDYIDELVKEPDGLETFVSKCYDLFDTFSQGYVTLDELRDQLKEETGVEIKR